MAYCEFLEKLEKLPKLLLAIFVNPLFVVYRFIKEITSKNYGLLVLDAVLGIVIYPVFWIANIVYIATRNEIFDFRYWFADRPFEEQKTEEKKPDDQKVIEAEVEEQKEDEKQDESK